MKFMCSSQELHKMKEYVGSRVRLSANYISETTEWDYIKYGIGSPINCQASLILIRIELYATRSWNWKSSILFYITFVNINKYPYLMRHCTVNG
jgi:hypothetical protein